MNSLYTPEQLDNMNDDEKIANLLAESGRSMGLVEASILHDPEHTDEYLASFERLQATLRSGWDKLPTETQNALEFAISETQKGIERGVSLNAVLGLFRA